MALTVQYPKVSRQSSGQLRLATLGPLANNVFLLIQPTDWKVVTPADVNHDGWTDIVWQSPDSAVGCG